MTTIHGSTGPGMAPETRAQLIRTMDDKLATYSHPTARQIDEAAAEAMPCPVCGGPCHSYIERNNDSRIVLAVCDDVRCGREVAI